MNSKLLYSELDAPIFTQQEFKPPIFTRKKKSKPTYSREENSMPPYSYKEKIKKREYLYMLPPQLQAPYIHANPTQII